MKHRNHLICLLPALVLAVWLIFGGGSTALTGVGLVLLICPITMGVVMWLLMRQTQATKPAQSPSDQHDQITAGGR